MKYRKNLYSLFILGLFCLPAVAWAGKVPKVATTGYLTDKPGYISPHTNANIEKVLAYLATNTDKRLYVMINRSPDVLGEPDADSKFEKETQRFAQKVHKQSDLGNNAVLMIINFAKVVADSGRVVTYLQNTGIAVGNGLSGHEINTPTFRNGLQRRARGFVTREDYARALIYQVHQKLGGFAPDLTWTNATTQLLNAYEKRLDVGNGYCIRISHQGQTKYHHGEKAYFMRQDKQEVSLELLDGKGKVVKGVDWELYDKLVTEEEGERFEMKTGEKKWTNKKRIKVPIDKPARNGNGLYLQAKTKEVTVKINLVAIDVRFERNIEAMMDSAFLYPFILPADKAVLSYIQFSSSKPQIIKVKEQITEVVSIADEFGIASTYFKLPLTATGTGTAVIKAQVGGKTFSSTAKVTVITNPPLTESGIRLNKLTANEVDEKLALLSAMKLLKNTKEVNGIVAPVHVKPTLVFYLKGDKWYPVVTRVMMEYVKDYRLTDDQKEIAGNVTSADYCDQLMALTLQPKLNASNKNKAYYEVHLSKFSEKKAYMQWMLLDQVKAHEDVHEMRIGPSLFGNNFVNKLEKEIEKHALPDYPQRKLKSNTFFQDKLLKLKKKALELWVLEYAELCKHDHDKNGFTEVAMTKVAKPVIQAICKKATAQNWMMCLEHDICGGKDPVANVSVMRIVNQKYPKGHYPDLARIDMYDKTSKLIPFVTLALKELNPHLEIDASQITWYFLRADKAIEGSKTLKLSFTEEEKTADLIVTAEGVSKQGKALKTMFKLGKNEILYISYQDQSITLHL